MREIYIKKHSYKKIEEEVVYNLPEKTLYLFKFGSRISIRVIPESYPDTDIINLKIVLVKGCFENKIELISVASCEIANFIAAESELSEVLKLIHEHSDREIRTKEQFEADFQAVLNNINPPIPNS